MDKIAVWIAIATALISIGITYGTLNSQVSVCNSNIGEMWPKLEELGQRISHLEGKQHR